jgi:hypothetical protein
VVPPQLSAEENGARAVCSMRLEDLFGEVKPDCANLVHGRLLEWPAAPQLWHVGAVGGVHPIKAGERTRLTFFDAERNVRTMFLFSGSE